MLTLMALNATMSAIIILACLAVLREDGANDAAIIMGVISLITLVSDVFYILKLLGLV